MQTVQKNTLKIKECYKSREIFIISLLLYLNLGGENY